MVPGKYFRFFALTEDAYTVYLNSKVDKRTFSVKVFDTKCLPCVKKPDRTQIVLLRKNESMVYKCV